MKFDYSDIDEYATNNPSEDYHNMMDLGFTFDDPFDVAISLEMRRFPGKEPTNQVFSAGSSTSNISNTPDMVQWDAMEFERGSV